MTTSRIEAMRTLPPDMEPVVQQALLNLVLAGGSVTLGLDDITGHALATAEKINAEFDAWLTAKRSRKSIAIEPEHVKEERRERRVTRR